MPYLGLFPFLRGNRFHYKKGKKSFNALSRAIPISTPEETEKPEETEMFQCPISGYSHFYYQYRNIYKGGLNKFQCPISGYSHCYKDSLSSCGNSFKRFNALSRAIPISTHTEEGQKMMEKMMFQCPISGYSHFYDEHNESRNP